MEPRTGILLYLVGREDKPYPLVKPSLFVAGDRVDSPTASINNFLAGVSLLDRLWTEKVTPLLPIFVRKYEDLLLRSTAPALSSSG